ncbi:transglutaminase family protein [uncultured Azohydromonas sp.]|jgi:Transglutaminase-like enzymes, putative cysteine proteases|uniref:transglutaminase family protein n=1 Tax=uncultured Azohydromonas sp. TaxID=487342 RepID=UPI002616710C|nr:transglutaminase family protein [uncultured Azohydromonas sp.]
MTPHPDSADSADSVPGAPVDAPAPIAEATPLAATEDGLPVAVAAEALAPDLIGFNTAVTGPLVAGESASPIAADAPELPELGLAVEHTTEYHYGSPVELAQHVAWLRPREEPWQQLQAFDLRIEPPPDHAREDIDRHGNPRLLFSLARPHAALQVRARSRVRLLPRAAALQPHASQPWEAVAQRLRFQAGRPWEPAAEFTAWSPFVPRLAALRELAAPSFAPGRPLAQAAIELMQRIHDEFEYRSASTQIDTPLAEVLRLRRGVCQDFAHVLVGALRAMGLAARYVSGYLLTRPPPGRPALVGADASHAWAAVWCPGAWADEAVHGAWLELDPTNRVVPDTEHLRVAVGRDFGDVTPLRGVIRGGGTHSLSVRVHTVRWSNEGETLGVQTD